MKNATGASRRAFFAACCALAVCATGPATAIDEAVRQRQGIESLEEWKAYKGPKLTGELLRECVNLDARTNRLSDGLASLKAVMDAEEQELESARHWVDEKKKSLDEYDAEDVRDYNEYVEKEDAQLQVFNARVAEYNTFLETHNAAIGDYNDKCTGRMYLIRDWIAITPDP